MEDKKLWYCIIQGLDPEGNYWKQLVKDFIEADTKKEARAIVAETYLKDIPMRIPNKDKKEDSLLLALYEVEKNHYTREFYETKTCEVCEKTFRLVDKFNLTGYFGNYEICQNPKCTEVIKLKNTITYDSFNETNPVIYKITQISTGKCYIGQTIRSFTLRWWEHLKSKDKENKFHKELKRTAITDWTFQILKEFVKGGMTNKDLLEKETEYMVEHDSIENGFNTHVSLVGNSKGKVKEINI